MLTIEDLWRLEVEQLKRERETSDPDPEMWRWSPLDIQVFAQMLKVARDLATDGLRKLRFAEAGSGIGTKLYLARYHFEMEELGYEINDAYLALSRELEVRAEKCDFRTENPPWEKFDIVYISRPFKDDYIETAWERTVMYFMRPGAVLISAYAAVKPYDWPCYLRAPFRGVWVKPVAQGSYHEMIQRTSSGPDPLVPQPGPGRAR